jgi:curved DNA-binding protein CbpA
MPTARTGNPAGAPPKERVPNVHRVGCYICATFEATQWKAAPPDDGTPLEPFMAWRWFCSGKASGGTSTCRTKATAAGATVMDDQHDYVKGDPRTPCEVLGLLPTATPAEVKRQYYALTKLYHPDRYVGDKEDAQRFFVILEHAWDELRPRAVTPASQRGRRGRGSSGASGARAADDDEAEDDEDDEDWEEDEDGEEAEEAAEAEEAEEADEAEMADEEAAAQEAAEAEEAEADGEPTSEARRKRARGAGRAPHPPPPRSPADAGFRRRRAPPKEPRAAPQEAAWRHEPAQGEKRRTYWSITITPEKPAKQILAPTDAEKLLISQDNIRLLQAGFEALMVPGECVVMYHFGVERGKINNNPHDQGFLVADSARTPEDVAQFVTWSIRHFTGYPSAGKRRVQNIVLHFKVKPKGENETEHYACGYTFKDRREPWYARTRSAPRPQLVAAFGKWRHAPFGNSPRARVPRPPTPADARRRPPTPVRARPTPGIASAAPASTTSTGTSRSRCTRTTPPTSSATPTRTGAAIRSAATTKESRTSSRRRTSSTAPRPSGCGTTNLASPTATSSPFSRPRPSASSRGGCRAAAPSSRRRG